MHRWHMMSLSCNLKKLSEHYTRTRRKTRGICQSDTTKVPAHINTFTLVLKHTMISRVCVCVCHIDTVDIKWWTAVWTLEQQSLMKSGYEGWDWRSPSTQSATTCSHIFIKIEQIQSELQPLWGHRHNLVVGNIGAATQLTEKESHNCSKVHRLFMSTSHVQLMDRGPHWLSVS